MKKTIALLVIAMIGCIFVSGCNSAPPKDEASGAIQTTGDNKKSGADAVQAKE